MLKKTAVVGLAGLMLGVSPASADSISDGTTVATSLLAGLGVGSIGCMVLRVLTQDDEGEEEGYDRRGFYVALSPSYARENFSNAAVDSLRDTSNSVTNLKNNDDDSFGVTGRGGYRCHPYVSAELQFEWLDDFEGAATTATGTVRSKLEPLVMTTNVKGHLLTGRFQPFVLFGGGFMRMEAKALNTSFRDTDVDVALRFGGGLDIYATESIVVSVEGSYLMPTGKLDDLDYYSIGLGMQYRF
jgi:hypothetical protein